MQVYENTLRVPFFIRGPGNLPTNRDSIVIYDLSRESCPLVRTVISVSSADLNRMAHVYVFCLFARDQAWFTATVHRRLC
jgi:hypothetical protein